MGQSSSTQKPKPVQKSTWRPEVLLTEACDTSNYDPISIRKRRNSEALPVQRGPNKKDINKAIKFVQEFLPLYTSPNEVNISIGTSPLVAMDIETFSYNRALTDSKVQGEIKRVCSAAHKNAVFAKDLFNEQAGNIFKKFSFANQKEELIQAPNKFFKVGSFARSHSTPDISKYVAEGGNEKARDKDNQDITVNAFGTPIRRETEFENRNSASFHSHNSPEKRDQNKVGGQYRDIIQDSQNYPGFRPTEREQNNDLSVSVDQTKKQSISFRIESKDQSKASEEDLGFRANTQVKPQAPPAPIRGVIGLPEGHQAQAESQEKILIQNTYNEKVSHQEPQGYQYVNPPPASPSKYNQRVQVQNPLQTQQYVANTNRTLQTEEKNLYNNAKNVSQQQQAVRKEVNKPQIASQKYPSKQWPSLSPVSDRRDRSKENAYNEKHQLKKQSKISSDKSPVKKERQHEPIAQKREEYMSQNNPQRKKNDPLRQSNLVQSSQGYKTNKVEKSPMSLKQVKSQGRYDLNVTERNNYQSQPMKVQKNIEVTPQQTTPQQPRTNKWLTDAHKMQVSNSSPQFNVDVNPINVDLNLDELLRAADRNGGYGIQNVTPGVYANYNDGFSPNFNSRFSSRFQEHQNPATQYISPKQLDETAYYEENSQFDRRNNSFLHSRHDISQDLNDHSMDNSQLNNSYVRRNKYGNALQPEVLAHRFTQNPEYH